MMFQKKKVLFIDCEYYQRCAVTCISGKNTIGGAYLEQLEGVNIAFVGNEKTKLRQTSNILI